MPLLEREGPLASLEKDWAEAQEGHGVLVCVGGEAGVGKTSLVREFAGRVRGARILVGACDAMSTPRPLGPLMDVATAVGGELLRSVVESAGPAAAFAALLAELGARPTVFIVEDAHWADAATIDLLRFLSRRIGGRKALLIVTYRDDELGAQHPLRVLIGDLATSTDLHRIALRPLSETAVQTLAAGSGVDAAALFQRTGGNPFFVTELLSSRGSTLPDTVRDAVLARAARLPQRARTVLELAAVIGATAELALLAEILGEKAPVEPCIESGLLRWDHASVSFRHDLARQAILAVLPPGRLRHLHARILAALRAPCIRARARDAVAPCGRCRRCCGSARVRGRGGAGGGGFAIASRSSGAVRARSRLRLPLHSCRTRRAARGPLVRMLSDPPHGRRNRRPRRGCRDPRAAG